MNIELRKRQFEVMLAEYERAICDALEWWEAYQLWHPKGFRAVRRKEAETPSKFAAGGGPL